jgi:tRNA uridine 5-carboxymethylaminomethyl modification enzyme
VHSLPGLSETLIVRPAYAVEYDYLPAVQFDHALMSKDLPGFFAAGQMLGTSGYEEAAAQGIIAGINAARYVQELEPFKLPRSSSYTATLVDDLVTKEIHEPYRMMTSRSEYRLLLRQDNADLRMTPSGRAIGLVDDERWAIFQNKYEEIKSERARLKETRIHPTDEWQQALAPYEEKLNQAVTLEELLRRPRIPYQVIETLCPQAADNTFPWAIEIETDIKYAGYIERQKHQIAQVERLDNVKLPKDVVFSALENLSKEAREKLDRIRPETLGQASRIAGVSPADISVLLVVLEARRRETRRCASTQAQSPEAQPPESKSPEGGFQETVLLGSD